MQTALHIKALVEELQARVTDSTIVATEFYKKQRAAYFFFKTEKTRLALGFVFHPAGAGTFLVPASKVKIATREKPWPIFDLVGARIIDINQTILDRIFLVHLEREKKRLSLAVEAIGPNGNIWLLDENDGRIATLRKRTYESGATYESAPVPDRISPFDLTSTTLSELIAEGRYGSAAMILEKQVIGFNRTMAHEALTRAGLPSPDAASLSENDRCQLADTVQAIAGTFVADATGYLYELHRGVEVYPLKLSSAEGTPEKFKTLSMAAQAMTGMRQSKIEQFDEEKSVIDMIKLTAKRLQKRLVNIGKDIEKASNYERYKRTGELIQINIASITKGQTEVVLENIYTEPHEQITVRLNPALSPAENAEAYFRKYRKGRDGLELLKRRLEITQGELEQLQTMESSLVDNFQSAREQYRQEIDALLPHERGSREVPSRLPYKVHTLSTGLTVFVGRDGSDNDRTTFEFARPHELWFHAQQCAGSHVVMKHPSKSFEPSKREIEEAAALAAYYSKARKNKLVPVIYTQRKYVRKPRKAKPGLVTVEREKSVMVPPGKSEND
ncbi:MAG: DUF814 domain-containing protein [candidate division Zixibacteria bacterium]|nr:DUF814 domain-containing protein [candidate division Zixibacteria bacterium]